MENLLILRLFIVDEKVLSQRVKKSFVPIPYNDQNNIYYRINQDEVKCLTKREIQPESNISIYIDKRLFEIRFDDQNQSSISPWPKKTDLPCFWCCHTFQTPPMFLPIHYDEKENIFTMKYNFCSFSCSVAFWKKFEFKEDYGSLLLLLHHRLYGRYPKNTRLHAAPPIFYLLKNWGGNLSIEEYRNINHKSQFGEEYTEITEHYPPIYPIYPRIMFKTLSNKT